MSEDDRKRQLWCAVILAALSEGTGETIPTDVTPQGRERVQHTARQWFIRAGRDFHTVCSLAEMEPERVREKAIEMFEAADARKRNGAQRPTRRGRQRGEAQNFGEGQRDRRGRFARDAA